MLKFNKFIVLSLLLLSGCTNTNNSRTSSSNVSSTSTSTSTSSSSASSSSTSIITSNKYNDVIYDGYYQAVEQSVYFKDVRKSYLFKNDLPSIGDQKILVVPVKFTDSTYVDSSLGGHDKVKSDLEKMFFGDESETGWESVASFYNQSSYGKLNLTGKVSDWCELDMTFSQAANIKLPATIATPTVYLAREVGKWYLENYDDASEYDLDKNGYIDALWMVYDWPANHSTAIDWAHCYWDYTNTDEVDINNPIPYTYAWASAGFMYEGKYFDENNIPLVDARTYIHETGHMLGLDDYYDTDNKHSYAGCLDMMDYNIGDHNMFSKYLLNWANPYVVTDDCEITIRPSHSSGDFIIVKDNWNHSSTDEYLLIEFYTPTGLNEMDAKESYMDEYPLMYQNPGIKIYHIDARLGYFANYRFSKYTDEIIGVEGNDAFSTRLAHSNTASINAQSGIFNSYYLLHLLENEENPKLHGTRVPATDNTLFHEGDVFDPYYHEICFTTPEYFNDGEFISYTIEVSSLSMENATIKFTRL